MNTLNILLIEDDQIETLKFQRLLSTFSGKHKQQNVTNGEQALALLKSGKECGKELPNIILLDLNMPKMNGLEFLQILKSNIELQSIPVVVLTTSNNQKDIKKAYSVGAAGYIMKPLKYEDYKAQLKTIIDYWSTNQLT